MRSDSLGECWRRGDRLGEWGIWRTGDMNTSSKLNIYKTVCCRVSIPSIGSMNGKWCCNKMIGTQRCCAPYCPVSCFECIFTVGLQNCRVTVNSRRFRSCGGRKQSKVGGLLGRKVVHLRQYFIV